MVYLARDLSDPLFNLRSIKVMYGAKMAEKNVFPSIKREVKILYEIVSIKGCIQLLDVFGDHESLSLVFPYYIRGDLYRYSKISSKNCFSEQKARYICKQLVDTLILLHEKGIIHRDLKPENILVGEYLEVVITDFGFAIHKEELERDKVYNRVGTLEFYPVEMLTSVTGIAKEPIRYDERVDIWSMGVVIFELLYGKTPFVSSKG